MRCQEGSVPASSLPSSVETTRCDRRSVLLPTIMIHTHGSACSFSSLIHLSRFSNVAGFVMSYRTSAPTAPLQYLWEFKRSTFQENQIHTFGSSKVNSGKNYKLVIVPDPALTHQLLLGISPALLCPRSGLSLSSHGSGHFYKDTVFSTVCQRSQVQTRAEAISISNSVLSLQLYRYTECQAMFYKTTYALRQNSQKLILNKLNQLFQLDTSKTY